MHGTTHQGIDRLLASCAALTNEPLRGGGLRLPVHRIDRLVSPAMSPNEELRFPSSDGDGVDLPDEGEGKVLSPTPEFIRIVKLYGARLANPTAEFLLKSPVNLSRGFRISTRFWKREQLIRLKVEFAEASTSSLDCAIIADFDGSLARRYEFLIRALQLLAFDYCLANHWEISFIQITLYNAYPTTTPPSHDLPASRAKLPRPEPPDTPDLLT